jgi:hypothetical protein
MSRAHIAVALALLAVACERGADPEKARALAARALRGSITYPQSSLVSISAGEDAAEVVLTTPAEVATVAEWYRRALSLNGWELRSDQADRAGTVTIYADKAGRPLWLTLSANTGGPGTTYKMVGAIIESDSIKQAR